ncbi:MAG: hypothetical protein ACRD2J_16520 [Thermoanaerobaculia bacterium]
MHGKRLVVGLVVMGIVVPAILFFFLRLGSFGELFTVAATCFLAWGIADFTADILARPRLANRTPGSAFREIEMNRDDE